MKKETYFRREIITRVSVEFEIYWADEQDKMVMVKAKSILKDCKLNFRFLQNR